MSSYELLTPAAADAISWVMVRLPDPAFASFREQLEVALSEICLRHGVTPDVLEGFKVKHFVSNRPQIKHK